MLVWPTNCQRQTRRQNIEISNSGYTLGTAAYTASRHAVQTTNIKPRAQRIHTHTQTQISPKLAAGRSRPSAISAAADARTHAMNGGAPLSQPRPQRDENKNITNELCICGAFDARTRKRMVAPALPPICRRTHRLHVQPAPFTQRPSHRGPHSKAAAAAALTFADSGEAVWVFCALVFFHIVKFIDRRTPSHGHREESICPAGTLQHIVPDTPSYRCASIIWSLCVRTKHPDLFVRIIQLAHLKLI